MRTSSVHLDDSREARLHSLCQSLGLSQTEVVKAALEQMASSMLWVAHDYGLRNIATLDRREFGVYRLPVGEGLTNLLGPIQPGRVNRAHAPVVSTALQSP